MHYFEIKKIKNFLGRGYAPMPLPLGTFSTWILVPSVLDSLPTSFFDKSNTGCESGSCSLKQMVVMGFTRVLGTLLGLAPALVLAAACTCTFIR